MARGKFVGSPDPGVAVSRHRGSSWAGGRPLGGLAGGSGDGRRPYSYVAAGQLVAEGLAWLRRITTLQVSPSPSDSTAKSWSTPDGWPLPVGCVEYGTGNRHAAETTRQRLLPLGTEAGHGEIIAWAHEMRAWINLTAGDYHGVAAAARGRPSP